MAPKSSSFPILTSTGRAARWPPNAVSSILSSKAPTLCSLAIEESTLSIEGGSMKDAENWDRNWKISNFCRFVKKSMNEPEKILLLGEPGGLVWHEQASEVN